MHAAALSRLQGKFTYESGACYEGQWEAGVYQGHGKFTWPDGRRWVCLGAAELQLLPSSTYSQHVVPNIALLKDRASGGASQSWADGSAHSISWSEGCVAMDGALAAAQA